MSRWMEWIAAGVKFVFAGLLIAALVVFARPIGRIFFPVPYASMVKREAVKQSVDPFLVVALMRAESGFDPDARSSKGAMGLMQLLPETAEEVAGDLGEDLDDVDRLYDPATNIRLGTKYLADLMESFDGELAIALAAYNGGGSNVRRWLAEGTWTGKQEHIDQIPFPETRNFVGRVLRFRDFYRFLYRGDWSLTAPAHRVRDPSPSGLDPLPRVGLSGARGWALSHR